MKWLIGIALLFSTELAAQSFEYPIYEDNPTRIAVHHTGKQPDISDFATAFLDFAKNDSQVFETVRQTWVNYQKNKPLNQHTTLFMNVKNRYWHYECFNPKENDTIIVEMCYWKCADSKHKLLAVNGIWKMNSDYGYDDFVGTQFFLYDNKDQTMRIIYADDIGALYDGDGLSVFFLPRKGKNIKVSAAGGGERWEELLEWDGYQFTSKP